MRPLLQIEDNAAKTWSGRAGVRCGVLGSGALEGQEGQHCKRSENNSNYRLLDGERSIDFTWLTGHPRVDSQERSLLLTAREIIYSAVRRTLHHALRPHRAHTA